MASLAINNWRHSSRHAIGVDIHAHWILIQSGKRKFCVNKVQSAINTKKKKTDSWIHTLFPWSLRVVQSAAKLLELLVFWCILLTLEDSIFLVGEICWLQLSALDWFLLKRLLWFCFSSWRVLLADREGGSMFSVTTFQDPSLDTSTSTVLSPTSLRTWSDSALVYAGSMIRWISKTNLP